MIQQYRTVSIIYGGSGRAYAEKLNDKITEISNEKRYPIQGNIINEKILTGELLSDVMMLFKDSEYCVAFLTQDDDLVEKGTKKKRLRQNVVFELGMALIELGRERCILLSDFDIRDPQFDLPSDMYSLEIKSFQGDDIDIVITDVLKKLLTVGRSSFSNQQRVKKIPRYNDLLIRKYYYIDYENIFSERPVTLASEGRKFFSDTLSFWIEECEALPHFDEKCIYLLERLGFLPIFGNISASVRFMERAGQITENYDISDLEYYENIDILNFTKNLVHCVIDYTLIKTKKSSEQSKPRKYRKLLNDFLLQPVPENCMINPLMKVAYYDYLGLTYLRLNNYEKSEEHQKNALNAFLISMDNASSVDMSLQVWKGFLSYNIARVYDELKDIDKAEEYFAKAVTMRNNWLKDSHYNVTVRNALSGEYFIAKIGQIDMKRRFGLFTDEETRIEYRSLENELDAYSSSPDDSDRLVYIREILKSRINHIK